MASIRFFKKSRSSPSLPTYMNIRVIFLVRNSQSHKTKFPLNLQWTKSINNVGLTGIISCRIEITNNSLGTNHILLMKTIKWSIRICHPVKNYSCCRERWTRTMTTAVLLWKNQSSPVKNHKVWIRSVLIQLLLIRNQTTMYRNNQSISMPINLISIPPVTNVMH